MPGFLLFLRLLELDPLPEDRVVFLELHFVVRELLLVLPRPDDVPGAGRFELDEVILRHAGHYTLLGRNGQNRRPQAAYPMQVV